MNSKEALEILSDWANGKTKLTFTQNCELYNIVLQDLNELEQYKQLERELGIDLITLFKALKSGVWYREWKEPIKHTCGLRLLKSGKSCWGLDNKNYYFPLEEYSKTWSLRKEDLEDDK